MRSVPNRETLACHSHRPLRLISRPRMPGTVSCLETHWRRRRAWSIGEKGGQGCESMCPNDLVDDRVKTKRSSDLDMMIWYTFMQSTCGIGFFEVVGGYTSKNTREIANRTFSMPRPSEQVLSWPTLSEGTMTLGEETLLGREVTPVRNHCC